MTPKELSDRIKALYHVRHTKSEVRRKMIQQQMANAKQPAGVSFAEMMADLRKGAA